MSEPCDLYIIIFNGQECSSQNKSYLVHGVDFLFADINMDAITTADNNINLMNITTAVTPTVPPMPEDLFKFLHNYSSPNAAVCFKM